MRWTKFFYLVCAVVMFFSANTCFASLIIPVYLVEASGQGQQLGTVTLEDTAYGLLLVPNLQGLPQGAHGFHVHVKPSCEDHGNAAGGHLDPGHTDHHRGPYQRNGHLGDLPVLVVDEAGKATLPVLAPRLKSSQLKGHSLMIHAKGDDYTDNAMKNNPRLACGVVPSH